ncbi:MAG: ABC transporter permease [Clostridiales bacterium]|jgi:ABC-2 type transport system permease protein|nr:ABC transporter permease [Clostridiales bacterium]
MKAFLVQLRIQVKSDLRDKGILMVYYLVPLVFYAVMGSIMKTLEMDSGTPLNFSITIFALSMSAFLGMPQALVKARETGILDAYKAAGIPAWSMPLATIVISTFHIMIVALVILFSAPYLFASELPGNIGLYLLAVLLIALCSETLGALLSCFVKKQNTLTLVSQCLFLPTIMFSGIMFPANLLPKPMQWIGEILPATQGMHMFSQAGLHMQPLIILCAMTIVFFAVSASLFRRISARK